jgi:hypothetical protein
MRILRNDFAFGEKDKRTFVEVCFITGILIFDWEFCGAVTYGFAVETTPAESLI